MFYLPGRNVPVFAYVAFPVEQAEDEERADLECLLKKQLGDSSAFAAFKRWLIRDHRENYPELFDYIQLFRPKVSLLPKGNQLFHIFLCAVYNGVVFGKLGIVAVRAGQEQIVPVLSGIVRLHTDMKCKRPGRQNRWEVSQ